MAQQQVPAAHNALHQPVLLRTCVELLSPAIATPGAVLIDCTLGMGGHSEAILAANPHVQVIGIDRDRDAIELASQRLKSFGSRFQAVQTTYDQVAQVAAEFGCNGKVNAILMDLGVSSLQLDTPHRGFSYIHDAPLDMRMDPQSGVSARDLLATATVGELTKILRIYGEEKYAAKIAGQIVRQRMQRPLETTGELVELIRAVLPEKAKRTGGNPAKRTFQALRIAVNNELEILQSSIHDAIAALAVNGRLVVESYHSLEDRIVKEAFNKGLKSTTPPGLPVELSDHQPYLQALVRGAMKADAAEIELNPRSRSVRLRGIERIRLTPKHLLLQDSHLQQSVRPINRGGAR
ncbi:16S rRNA (cytosine(1402)-N(4))-methyltransferase RsmH [Arcanobacterium hippocoleae]|uniref:Ribosomal RNA small subunit methyltransferase H n=1 Tax=Arcanobacterium hippocoleae TaxID=149017 RepID=A0ABU1T0Y2_9ACTO|nr:16S rRNA (cytosine(1402)-N(4))-methyltransferase RsmH [Arcanobacterium hippocoleae]MDR6939010.1 16S rRNA (cytosine1402-N4)-methyltransferase [Arcanobacterium hippocoleae]